MQVSKWGVPFPELQAYQYNDKGNAIAWCGYCHRYHLHGDAVGHRTAHCDNGSPYKDTGYILVDMGRAPKWMIRDHKLRHPYGKPESKDGNYEHFLMTLTCKKAAPIVNRSRKTSHALKKEGMFKLWFPYGQWTCGDGREILFNYHKEPIWERGVDIAFHRANPYETPENITNEVYYYDDIATLIRREMVLINCLVALSDFGVNSYNCNIPHVYFE